MFSTTELYTWITIAMRYFLIIFHGGFITNIYDCKSFICMVTLLHNLNCAYYFILSFLWNYFFMLCYTQNFGVDLVLSFNCMTQECCQILRIEQPLNNSFIIFECVQSFLWDIANFCSKQMSILQILLHFELFSHIKCISVTRGLYVKDFPHIY